jgi:hypothetical protein
VNERAGVSCFLKIFICLIKLSVVAAWYVVVCVGGGVWGISCVLLFPFGIWGVDCIM